MAGASPSPVPLAGVENIAQPSEQSADIRATIARLLYGIVLVAAMVVALYLGRAFLLPVVTAYILSLILGPLLVPDSKSELSRSLGATAVVAGFVVVLNVIVALLAQPIMYWIEHRDEIRGIVVERLAFLGRSFESLHELQKSLVNLIAGDKISVAVEPSITEMLSPIVAFTTPALGQLLIFIGSLFFFLVGRVELRHLVASFPRGRATRLSILRTFNSVEVNLMRYFVVVTAINVGMGLLTAAVAYLAGLPTPLIYGIFAFVLNYIPYIGPAIVTGLLLLAGLTTPMTLLHAVAAPIVYLILGFLEGHFVTPAIVGRHLTLSAMAVFFALTFWTWLWGPIGALLASPFLIIAMTIREELLPSEQISLPG